MNKPFAGKVARHLEDIQPPQEQQPELLPDLSQELASMGRGSMQRKITQLQRALDLAKAALEAIENGSYSGDADDYAAVSLNKVLRLEQG